MTKKEDVISTYRLILYPFRIYIYHHYYDMIWCNYNRWIRQNKTKHSVIIRGDLVGDTGEPCYNKSRCIKYTIVLNNDIK